jgi:hypothetical protein
MDERDPSGDAPAEPAQPPQEKRRKFGPGLELNAIALMASTAITAVVGLGFWAIAGNALPVADVGRASAVITTATMISQLSGSNIGLLFSRVLPAAGRRSRTVVLAGYAVAIAIALVLTGAFLLFFTSDELFVSGLERALFPLLVITFVLFALQDWVLTGIRATAGSRSSSCCSPLAKLGLLIWFVAAAVENAIVLAWAIPCLATVLVINPLLLGRVLPRRPPAPRGRRAMPGRRALGRIFLAEYATGAVTFVIPLTRAAAGAHPAGRGGQRLLRAAAADRRVARAADLEHQLVLHGRGLARLPQMGALMSRTLAAELPGRRARACRSSCSPRRGCCRSWARTTPPRAPRCCG